MDIRKTTNSRGCPQQRIFAIKRSPTPTICDWADAWDERVHYTIRESKPPKPLPAGFNRRWARHVVRVYGILLAEAVASRLQMIIKEADITPAMEPRWRSDLEPLAGEARHELATAVAAHREQRRAERSV